MKRFSVVAFACVVLALLGISVIAQGKRDGQSRTVAEEPPKLNSPAIELTRAYIKGMEAGKLDELNELFLPKERSSVLENASDEGSWEHYRDHHLAPEMKEAPDFKFTIEKEAEDRFGSTSVVRQLGNFTVTIDGVARSFKSAVTYVIIEVAGKPKIAHLHWSSRERK